MPEDARIRWIDAARGIGIALVVFGHAWRGIHTAGLIRSDSLFAFVDRFIYAFHMPLFFLLSGLFVSFPRTSAGLGATLWDRAVRILYPMLIWSTLFTLARVAAGDVANTRVPLANLLELPFARQDQFWFLWALFVVQAGTLLALCLLRPVLREDRVWHLLLALSVILSLGLPPLVRHWPAMDELYSVWLRNPVKFAPFFLIGVIFARAIRSMRLSPAWLPAVLAGLAGLGVLAATVHLGAVPRLLVATIMSFCVLALSQIACQTRPDGAGETVVTRVLVTLGQATLAIFVAHTILSAATRVLLMKAGVTSVPVYVLVVTLAGLFGPLVLLYLADRLNIAGLAGLRSLRRTRPARLQERHG